METTATPCVTVFMLMFQADQYRLDVVTKSSQDNIFLVTFFAG